MSELHIIFDGPPSHESGRFVEVETSDGYSIDAGKWEQRGDYWHLILPNDRTAANKRITELEAALAAVTAERDALRVDAERYRWVRSLGDKSDEELDALDICTPKSSVDFDRIVDAFIGAAAKEQP